MWCRVAFAPDEITTISNGFVYLILREELKFVVQHQVRVNVAHLEKKYYCDYCYEVDSGKEADFRRNHDPLHESCNRQTTDQNTSSYGKVSIAEVQKEPEKYAPCSSEVVMRGRCHSLALLLSKRAAST